MFDIVFYTTLLFSTILGYKIIKSPTTANWFYKSLKLLLVLFAASMWIWQILLWTWPKGNKIEEAVRLPRHLWVLDNMVLEDSALCERKSYGQHPRQHYIYYPAKKDSPLKNTVIFYVHGGGWRLGGPHQHRYLAKKLHDQGYTLILPAYRFVPEFNSFDLQEDINNAFLHSLNYLKEQGISNPQLILGGTSAGGNLATLLAYDEARWQKMGLDRKLLKGAFSIVGVLDLDKMDHNMALIDYTGEPYSEEYHLCNPVSFVNQQDSFPFLCLHGDSDGLAVHENAVSFCSKLGKILPEMVDFRTFPNASHIDIGSGWYYDDQLNVGQDTALFNWLNKIAAP